MEELLKELEEIKKYSLLSAKEMLSVEDLSLLIGMKPSYIHKLVQQKRLPYYKPFGKQIYFKKAEINRVLENKDSRIPSIDELINNRQWKR